MNHFDNTNSVEVKNEFDKDDHNIKFGSKVRQLVKIYENNFVDKSPVKPESTRVVIERNLENKNCGFKNAFEAIMKSGGDTPHRKTPRNSGRNSGLKKLKRLDKDQK